MGEFFSTEFWFNLAGKTYNNFLNLYNEDIKKRPNLNGDGETIEENKKSQNTENDVSTDSKHKTWLSIIKNNMEAGHAIMKLNEILKLKLKEDYKKNSTPFLRILNVVHKIEDR